MANISLLPIITLVVVLVVLVIIFNYLYGYFINPDVPLAWAQAIKNGKVTKRLRKLKSRYPDKTRFYLRWVFIKAIAL
jgi:hypothetical protein